MAGVGTAVIPLEQLRARAQRFMEDVAREGHLAHAGFKVEAELQRIYAEYADILTPDTLQECAERFHTAPEGSEERRAARMMLEWQVEAQVGRRLVPLEEREIVLEGTAVVRLDDGREIPLQEAPIEIMNSADRRERHLIDDARAAVVREHLMPLRLEYLQREREYVEAVGVAPSYNATFELLSGISLRELASECAAFLRDTAAMWEETRRERLRAAGIPQEEATRADALALFRLKEFDAAFPASSMEETIRRNCAEMRIDATAGGHIVFDLGDRAGKRSRAFCAPVRVPEEVYLVLRPHGGQTDYNTLLHELGHALHFGYARADYPFEYRWLGDNSVTEGYAMLFDHRMHDRGWLSRYTGLGRAELGAFLRLVAFEELHFLRRYCAKLLYEVQLYSGTVPWDALPALYAESLTDATAFRYHTADAFTDLDPRYYSVRYLRAWQLQAVLDEALTARFDEDWWRNPSAGPWIVQSLFAEGQRESADEIAARVGVGMGVSVGARVGAETDTGVTGALGFAPLIAQVERLLGA